MVKIITDSTCDINFETLEKLGVEAIPLTVFFGEQGYKEKVEISTEEFYAKLAVAETLPTTSQVNPADFEEVFAKHIENGDEVLGIFLSGNLSGTCQSARIAAANIGSDKISIFDSKNVTIGLAVLLMEAVRLRDEGLSAKEIKAKLEEIKPKVKLVAMFSTLKYLSMGGRLSKTSATIGSLLGIMPLLAIEEGSVSVIGKVKGKKAAYKFIKDFFEENPADTTKTFAYAHSNSVSDLEDFKALMGDSVKNSNVITCDVGCVIGTHAGPGAVAIAYIGE
ncbi:MAG: DegV family protein [Clostridia bacterium]|nr:DegV family protein [Clostridia bacterium]